MEKNNKIILVVVLCAVVAAFAYEGLNIYSVWSKTDESVVPLAPLSVAGSEVEPAAVEWTEELLDGRVKKDFDYTIDRVDGGGLGELGAVPYTLRVELPGSGASDPGAEPLQLETWWTLDGGQLAEADAPAQAAGSGGAQEFLLTKAGEYKLVVRVGGIKSESGEGAFTYGCAFSVVYPEPEFTAGRTELQQGDIFPMRITNLPEGLRPESETKLGFSVWTKEDDPDAAPGSQTWSCAVPIGNHCAVGTYPISVKILGTDDEAVQGMVPESVDVQVSAYSFDHQNLIIDTSIPSIAESISPESGVEYTKKIPPLMTQYDEEQYWQGLFERPVQGGFISTNFGEIRITNGDASTSRSHYGMDFAVEEGVPVHAGNAGRVVLAEMLLRTGGTVVIEHGGGLKSYYFHMSRVDAVEGSMVEKGDQIGLVGSTGYSTGPHLHYEMRIGDQAIDPARLFEQNAGLFSANNNDENVQN
ncbi:MAG: M23 family metallopeptidase [Clostridiales Family XIII bacterium]|jgi:hypothetical protein|nr:M23 family metallopeptidase [Clostridiales Family XIII bacterium]